MANINNRPRSIYQYSNMAPRLSGQSCNFASFFCLSISKRRLGYKENKTKYRSLSCLIIHPGESGHEIKRRVFCALDSHARVLTIAKKVNEYLMTITFPSSVQEKIDHHDYFLLKVTYAFLYLSFLSLFSKNKTLARPII